MNRKIKLTKQCIREALFELLKTTDINKISISKLCEIADVNRSTFYKYYGSQYDVINELENEIIQNISEQLNQNPDQSSLIQILTYIQENAYILKLISNANIKNNFLNKLLSLSNLNEELQKLSPNHKDEYAKLYIIYGGVASIRHWIEKDCKETPTQMAQSIADITFKICK